MSRVINYFDGRIRPGELLYDTERDLLAIAKFLVLISGSPSFLFLCKKNYAEIPAQSSLNWTSYVSGVRKREARQPQLSQRPRDALFHWIF